MSADWPCLRVGQTVAPCTYRPSDRDPTRSTYCPHGILCPRAVGSCDLLRPPVAQTKPPTRQKVPASPAKRLWSAKPYTGSEESRGRHSLYITREPIAQPTGTAGISGPFARRYGRMKTSRPRLAPPCAGRSTQRHTTMPPTYTALCAYILILG